MPIKYGYVSPEEDDASKLVEAIGSESLRAEFSPNSFPKAMSGWTSETRTAARKAFPVVE